MFTPKISVIIPIHNSEKYLRMCLASLLNQTFTSLEILCIDDASSDASEEILKEFAQKDKRIRLFKNENNLGPGEARNICLKKAKGEYVSFVDSDDFIDPNFYHDLYSAAKNGKLDAVKSRRFYLYADTTEYKAKEAKIPLNKHINQAVASGLPFFLAWRYEWSSGIYKRDLIKKHNIRINRSFRFEDTMFLQNFLFHASKVKVIEGAPYYYNQNSASLVHQASDLNVSKAKELFYADTMLKIFQLKNKNLEPYLKSYFSTIFLSKKTECPEYYLLELFSMSLLDEKKRTEILQKQTDLLLDYQKYNPTPKDFAKKLNQLLSEINNA